MCRRRRPAAVITTLACPLDHASAEMVWRPIIRTRVGTVRAARMDLSVAPTCRAPRPLPASCGGSDCDGKGCGSMSARRGVRRLADGGYPGSLTARLHHRVAPGVIAKDLMQLSAPPHSRGLLYAQTSRALGFMLTGDPHRRVGARRGVAAGARLMGWAPCHGGRGGGTSRCCSRAASSSGRRNRNLNRACVGGWFPPERFGPSRAHGHLGVLGSLIACPWPCSWPGWDGVRLIDSRNATLWAPRSAWPCARLPEACRCPEPAPGARGPRRHGIGAEESPYLPPSSRSSSSTRPWAISCSG